MLVAPGGPFFWVVEKDLRGRQLVEGFRRTLDDDHNRPSTRFRPVRAEPDSRRAQRPVDDLVRKWKASQLDYGAHRISN